MRDIAIVTGVLVLGPVVELDEEEIAGDAITGPGDDITGGEAGE